MGQLAHGQDMLSISILYTLSLRYPCVTGLCVLQWGRRAPEDNLPTDKQGKPTHIQTRKPQILSVLCQRAESALTRNDISKELTMHRQIQNTQEIKRTHFNWTKQDKTRTFSRNSSFSSYVQHKTEKRAINPTYLVSVRCWGLAEGNRPETDMHRHTGQIQINGV